MRLRAAWAIPWLLAVLLSALSTQGSVAQDDNLLVNGGFEDGTAGWSAVGGGLDASEAPVRSGSYSGAFVTARVRAEVAHCLPVDASADYEFRGYAARREGDPESSLRLRVQWLNQDNCPGEGLWTSDSPMVTMDREESWYELAVSARSPNTARWAYLTVEVQETGATVYLDDFAVSGPAVPTETPTLEPSPDPSPSVSPIPTAGPQFTPAPSATRQHRTPSPSATPRVSPTASSGQRTPAPPQEALRNGSFEEADSEGLPSFWRKYGGELARTSAVRFEGQFAAALRSETTSTKWVYQIVTVQGGKAYVLSGYALKDDPAVAAAYLRISWYASPDGSGRAIDSADSTERLTDDSSEFRFLTTGAVVAPAEAASAKARLMLDPVSEAPGAVYFDVVTFEETAPPEPVLSPTATPFPDDDGETFNPPSPSADESNLAPGNVSTPAGSVTRPRSSPTPVRNSTPAVLAATREPAATATTAAAAAAATSTRAPAAVYRQRKSDPLPGDSAAAREESAGGGLSPVLLVLAAGLPALASAGAGAYYWRWRRARPR